MKPRFLATFFAALAVGAISLADETHAQAADEGRFPGKFFRGRGDVDPAGLGL